MKVSQPSSAARSAGEGSGWWATPSASRCRNSARSRSRIARTSGSEPSPASSSARIAVRGLADEREVGVERAPQALGRRQRRVGLGELQQLVGLRADRREVEAALALEVVVEQALRDARGSGYVVDRELVVGVLREQLAADREQVRATVDGSLAGGVASAPGALGAGS